MITVSIRVRMDGPLAVDWDMKLPILRQKLFEAAPKQSGALANSLRVSKHSDTAARIQSPLPYAHIQQFGGTVPARRAKGDTPMTWHGKFGWVRKWEVCPSKIEAKHYIESAVAAWLPFVDLRWKDA